MVLDKWVPAIPGILDKCDMENDGSVMQQAEDVFNHILESLIIDVASEAHRAAHLGIEQRHHVDEEGEQGECQASMQGRMAVLVHNPSDSENHKHGVDIFGQRHPAVATEVLQCMNCSRKVMAGRFAPHLERCMGKGRRTRQKRAANSN